MDSRVQGLQVSAVDHTGLSPVYDPGDTVWLTLLVCATGSYLARFQGL